MVKADANTKEVVKEQLHFRNVADFWEKVLELVKAEKAAGNISGKFASSYVRLVSHKESTLKAYKAHGYASLISKQFGKKNAAKITDEIAEAHLLELIAHPNQLDDVLICVMYNQWAKKTATKILYRKAWAYGEGKEALK
ncbi:hypothetical protein KRR40_12435 [Niabella defluvii]|nr:hypothetical protein KRR40_12435 [Niabella sp. I65]